MKGIVYKIAIFIALTSFVTSILNGISIATSIIRSGVVFLITLVVIIIALNLLRWGLMKSMPVTNQPKETDE